MGKKGFKHSPETIEKMSGKNNSFYGKKHSKESIEKIRLARLGTKLSIETIEKCRLAKLGKKFSEEHKRKLGDMKLGEKNVNWKGDDVSKGQLHVWVRIYLKQPEFCEMCNKVKPYDLANITGKYTRDFTNWKYLCRRCHMISDGRLDRLHKTAG